jgi:hypothetical protein
MPVLKWTENMRFWKSPTEFEWLVVCVVEIPDAPGSWERRNDPNKWNVRVFCLEYGEVGGAK